MACSATCYSNNPCSCNVQTVCPTENVTCAVKIAACAAKAAFTWSNNPVTGNQSPIKLSDIKELGTNIRSEQARRSYNASTGAATSCTGQSTFAGTSKVANQSKQDSIDWTELRTAINNLGAISEVGLTFTWTSTLSINQKIRIVSPTEFRANLDAIYRKCICNAKGNCGCNTYCGSNAVLGCTTNGCGQCSCYGDCGCNY